MAKRWIGVALLAWCLAPTTAARAQCGPQVVPGPLTAEQAPPGPGDCMSLPGGLPNAFSEECCDPCPRVWLDGQYIYWAIKSPRFSTPLVTTNNNPPPGNNPPTGLLGQEGTILVFREDSLKYSPVSGGRLSAGYWFDCHQCVGIEGSGFVTQQQSTSFRAFSGPTGSPLVFVPVFDATGAGTGTGPGEFGFANAIPDLRVGGTTITSTSRLWGAEVNLTNKLADCGCVGACWLLGFRYLDLNEDVAINQQETAINDTNVAFGVPFPNNSTSVTDHFRGHNEFYGAQVGVRAAACWRQLFFAVQGKVALGDMREVVTIDGTSTLQNATAANGGAAAGILPTSIAVGRFAAPSNIGRHFEDRFAVVPEFEGRIGVQLHPCVLAYVGYNFLYMSRVARPGDQIDRAIDLTTIPTAFEYVPGSTGNGSPRVPFNQSYFWAQGVNAGLEIEY